MDREKKQDISAQVLDILQKNGCSLADAETIFQVVTAKYRVSARLHCDDFLEELTLDYQQHRLP